MNLSLLSLPMLALLTAQFLSALADNALLIAAIAVFKSRGQADWVPLLQAVFVLPFILLAPYVGAFADAWPKGRVMFLANNLKLVGAGLAWWGHPLLGYGLAGVGAAAYSPAKYGILSQMFDKSKLVQANGLLEGSTIVAILLGVLAGGWLADHSVTLAFGAVLAVYALAALSNLLIPRLPPERPLAGHQLLAQGGDFLAGFKLLWHDREARFSLMGTSLFWGSGATLRLMLFAWVPVALALNDNQTPANLMGVVSVGIVVGAFLAGLLVHLAKVNRALIGGLLVGPLLMALAFSHNLTLAGLLLMGLGAAGGFLVVPLNALLQARGHGSIGAGRALAVQNFWENIAMLICVWLYAGAGFLGMPIVVMVAGFGGLVLAGMAALALSRRSAA